MPYSGMRALLGLVLLFASCSSTPWSGARVVEPEKILSPPLLKRAASILSTSTERGSDRLFQKFGESCVWNGGNPVVIGPRTEPRVGTPVEVSWKIEVVGPHQPRLVSLLAALRPLPAPIRLDGMPGCWLLVWPDYLLIPQADGWIRYDAGRGLVVLEWTPVSGMEGVDIFLQLLVAIPEANSLGHVVSSAIQLHIGAAHP